MTSKNSPHISKLLILDGIGGVPLGAEIASNIREWGIATTHFNCLLQTTQPFYGIVSAYKKLKQKVSKEGEFYFHPKIPNDVVRKLIKQEQPTHILVIGFAYKFCEINHLEETARFFGSKLFLYDTDSCNLYPKRREFIFFVEKELPIYDRIFSFSLVTTRFFRETRKLDAIHLPFGAQPSPLLAIDEKQIEVLFVGSCDLRRIFLLERIRDHVSIHGNRWQRNSPLISKELQSRISDTPVWGNTLHRLLASSKIVLNITRSDFFGAETGINLRIFEAFSAGRFLLTDHCDEIDDLFRPGTDLETYRSSEELIDKVAFYLKNEVARERIARQGHDTFTQRHTWKIRSRVMLDWVDTPLTS